MAHKNNSAGIENLLLQFISEPDPLYSMLEWMANQLMELEVAQKCCAEKGKHDENRTAQRSGTRVRRFDTRMGTIYLLVPKLRKGGYIPFFVTERKRSEQALIQVIFEAYTNGVSTRKIEKLAQSFGIENISAAQVSQISKEMDEQIKEYSKKPLKKHYPVLWIDALYEKIRHQGKVMSMAVMIVAGINDEGYREILAVEPMLDESESTYTELFKKLKDRGLEKVGLIVSDAHKGLQKAIRENFLGSSWQRCKVHFMRNIMARIPAKEKKTFAAKLKQIWWQPDIAMAKKYAQMLISEYQNKYQKAMETLEEGLEDSLQYYSFPEIDQRKIASTNILERLNREIRRRSSVVGIFPGEDAYVRLITSYLMEYEDEWGSISRPYVAAEKLECFQEQAA